MLLTLFIVAVVLMFIVGFYSLIATRNLVRVLIALEILTKATTLLMVLAGAYTGQAAQTQVYVVVMIMLEVILTAIAAGIVIGVFNRHESLSTRNITDLKE